MAGKQGPVRSFGRSVFGSSKRKAQAASGSGRSSSLSQTPPSMQGQRFNPQFNPQFGPPQAKPTTYKPFRAKGAPAPHMPAEHQQARKYQTAMAQWGGLGSSQAPGTLRDMPDPVVSRRNAALIRDARGAVSAAEAFRTASRGGYGAVSGRTAATQHSRSLAENGVQIRDNFNPSNGASNRHIYGPDGQPIGSATFKPTAAPSGPAQGLIPRRNWSL